MLLKKKCSISLFSFAICLSCPSMYSLTWIFSQRALKSPSVSFFVAHLPSFFLWNLLTTRRKKIRRPLCKSGGKKGDRKRKVKLIERGPFLAYEENADMQNLRLVYSDISIGDERETKRTTKLVKKNISWQWRLEKWDHYL